MEEKMSAKSVARFVFLVIVGVAIGFVSKYGLGDWQLWFAVLIIVIAHAIREVVDLKVTPRG